MKKDEGRGLPQPADLSTGQILYGISDVTCLVVGRMSDTTSDLLGHLAGQGYREVVWSTFERHVPSVPARVLSFEEPNSPPDWGLRPCDPQQLLVRKALATVRSPIVLKMRSDLRRIDESWTNTALLQISRGALLVVNEAFSSRPCLRNGWAGYLLHPSDVVQLGETRELVRWWGEDVWDSTRLTPGLQPACEQRLALTRLGLPLTSDPGFWSAFRTARAHHRLMSRVWVLPVLQAYLPPRLDQFRSQRLDIAGPGRIAHDSLLGAFFTWFARRLSFRLSGRSAAGPQ